METLKNVLLALALASPAAAQDPAPAPALPAAGEPLREAARQAVARHGASIVTVRLTVKTRMVYQGREHPGPEQTMEIGGTVVGAKGLTAVSDFSSNPAGIFAGSAGGPSVETETTDVRIVLADGKELPARIVLRDEVLDLAFLAPTEPAASLAPVALDAAAEPSLLDPLAVLYPLGRGLGRGTAAALTEVRAVVRKPRTFLAVGYLEGLQALGCPAFDARGRAVGLVVIRRGAGAMSPSGGMKQAMDSVSPVVLTAADVLEVAAQAAAAAERPAAAASPVPSPTPTPPTPGPPIITR